MSLPNSTAVALSVIVFSCAMLGISFYYSPMPRILSEKDNQIYQRYFRQAEELVHKFTRAKFCCGEFPLFMSMHARIEKEFEMAAPADSILAVFKEYQTKYPQSKLLANLLLPDGAVIGKSIIPRAIFYPIFRQYNGNSYRVKYGGDKIANCLVEYVDIDFTKSEKDFRQFVNQFATKIQKARQCLFDFLDHADMTCDPMYEVSSELARYY